MKNKPIILPPRKKSICGINATNISWEDQDETEIRGTYSVSLQGCKFILVPKH